MPDYAEQRDREIERTGGRRMTSPFSTKVVGVSFVPGYPHNLLDLADTIAESMQATGDEPFPAVLRRNPDNEYDANAIEVHAPVMGQRGMLGHLTRPISARMAPELDAGVLWAAEIEAVLIEPSAPHQPGVSIRCRRVERGDQIDADGFVRTQVASRPGGSGRDVLGVRDRPAQPDGGDGMPRWVAAPEARRDTSNDRVIDELIRAMRRNSRLTFTESLAT